jgi:hypothetical protein
MIGSRSRMAQVEILVMSLLIVSYTWFWHRAFTGDFLICVLLYSAIGFSSHRRRGETARQIGWRLDNLRSASWQACIFIGPLVLLTIGIGLWLGTERLDWTMLIRLPAGAAWGTAQQYGLLAFFYRRFCDVFKGEWTPAFAAAGMFGIFHLPNPFLTVVTLGAGVLACRLYSRVPNLLALGFAHGMLSSAIHRSLPVDVTFGLRVGPGFYRMVERLQDGVALLLP